uniref:Immunoglobulin V-set domain-containing protein n=1 Tax=Mastacembelus armatus TaxID=205130 RepID=A0A3Q3LV49_9TELE
VFLQTLIKCSVLTKIHIVFDCMFVFTVFTGSSAVTPVFVQKGKDVTLDVMKDGFHELDVVLWRFNINSILVRFVPGKEPIVSDVYTGRVEFPQKKYSVTLKNLQESDSGVYTAQLIGSAETQTVGEHKVTVQGRFVNTETLINTPVSPVKLTVDSVSSSSDSCNLTVTCSTQDSDITSRVTCDTTTCHQEGGESSKVTTSGASLRLYLVNSTINCNHSNQVSWTNDTKETGQACLLPPGKNQRDWTDLSSNHW